MTSTIEPIALAESWQLPRRLPAEHRKKLRTQADELEQALYAVGAQIVGLFVAQFDHMALNEPHGFADDIAVSMDYLGETAFEQALKQQLADNEQLIGTGAGMDPGSAPNEQTAYGSALVRGLLHQYGAALNVIISQGLHEGLTREQLRQRLLDQATPAMSQLMPEWRARLIAQTEAIRSWNAVSYHALLQAGQGYVRWIDGQVGACPDCSNMDGRIIPATLAAGNPSFVSNVRGLVARFPPLHPGCRCAIGGADAAEFRQQPNPGDYFDPNAGADGMAQPLQPLIQKSIQDAQSLAEAEAAAKAQAATPVMMDVPSANHTITVKMNVQAAVDDIAAAVRSKFGSTVPDETEIAGVILDWARAHDLAALNLITALHAATGKWPLQLFGGGSGTAPSPPVTTQAQTPAAATAASKVKAWLDDHPDLVGVKAAQGYAKHSGQAMAATKAALAAEGYVLADLIAAPKGSLPTPKAMPAPKPPGTTKAKVEKPLEYKAIFEQPKWAANADDYWDTAVQTGPQGGSNPGGKFTAKDGKSYYLKKYDNPHMAEAEVAAGHVYRLLGIQAPSAAIIRKGGQSWFASEWDDTAKPVTEASLKAYIKAHPKEAANLFIASVFTQNWDVVGLSYDNIMLTKKGLKAVDTGGSWTFRAKGGLKPYDPLANEFDNFLNPSVNPQSASVFKDLWTNPEAVAQARQATAWLRSNITYIYRNIPPGVRSGVSLTSMSAKLDDINAKLDALSHVPQSAHTSADDIAALQRFKAKVEDGISKHFGPATGGSGATVVADRWLDTSRSEEAMALKARMAELVYGIPFADAYIAELRRYYGSSYDESRDAINREIAAQLQSRVPAGLAASMWKQGQRTLHDAYKQHITPQNTIVVYRGIDNGLPGGTEAIKAVWDAIEGGGQPVWNANWAQSFSLDTGAAHNFGGSSDASMVIKLEVPVESVLLTPKDLPPRYSHEKEMIILGPAGGYQLPPGSIVKIRWQGQQRTYNEREPLVFARDGYFVSFTTAGQEDEWCKWLRQQA